MKNTDNDFIKSENIIIKLKLISKLSSRQKMNTVSLQIVNNSFATSVWRSLCTIIGTHGNSRIDLYNFISNVTNEAYELIKKYNISTNTVDRCICDNLKKEIILAKNNLLNGIRETYNDDTVFIAQLEQLHSSIELKLAALECDDYYESEMLSCAVST
jgi:hypothetical protein